jgi:hypothetical protein
MEAGEGERGTVEMGRMTRESRRKVEKKNIPNVRLSCKQF